MKTTLKVLALATLALGIVGCNQGRKTPPNTIVRVTNVVPKYGSVAFRRVESAPNALAYRDSQQFSYNQDTYDFHLEAKLANETDITRVVNFTKEVLAGTLYDFVFTQTGTTPDYKILEMPTPAAGATDAEVIGMHAADGTPAVDVYLEAPGTDVGTAVPWGTVAYSEALPVKNVATGEYELTLTEAGNPANVLLTSSAFTLNAATATSLIIAPDAGTGVATLSVIFVQDTSVTLYDKDIQAGVRVINAAGDMGARDIVLNGDYTTPLFPAVAFGAQTNYQLVPVGSNQLNVTPAGNPGVIELDQTVSTSASQLDTILVSGDPGTLTDVVATDDRRPVEGQASMHIFNAAPQFTSLDFYLVNPGTDITTVLPAAVLGVPAANAQGVFLPGTYDLVVTDASTGDVVAGPQSITLESAKFYTVLAVNGATSASVDLILLDDFN
jgi:Domain of unknown function (DUF4397)